MTNNVNTTGHGWHGSRVPHHDGEEHPHARRRARIIRLVRVRRLRAGHGRPLTRVFARLIKRARASLEVHTCGFWFFTHSGGGLYGSDIGGGATCLKKKITLTTAR